MSLAAALVVLTSSCKEDEEETTKDYLSGTICVSAPGYVYPGEEFTVTPSGAYAPDGSEVTYTWSCSPDPDTTAIKNVADDFTCTVHVPDTLCTLSLSCVAKADGYYSTSSVLYLVVVGKGFPSSSLVLPKKPADVQYVIDNRDGRVYSSTQIGGLRWLRENLAWNGAGASFAASDKVDNVFGRYYTYEEVASTTNPVCPEGWRVPTDADWKTMAQAISADCVSADHEVFQGIAGKLMPLAYFNGERVWEYVREVQVTDNAPFCALPAGYAILGQTAASFLGTFEYATFWTADAKDSENAYCRTLHLKSKDVRVSAHDRKSFGASVRCVK